MSNTIDAREIAELLLDWYKGYDWYEYRDTVGDDEEEAIQRDTAEIERGNTDAIMAFLSDALDEMEDIDERHEILNLMDMIREYECENEITH